VEYIARLSYQDYDDDSLGSFINRPEAIQVLKEFYAENQGQECDYYIDTIEDGTTVDEEFIDVAILEPKFTYVENGIGCVTKLNASDKIEVGDPVYLNGQDGTVSKYGNGQVIGRALQVNSDGTVHVQLDGGEIRRNDYFYDRQEMWELGTRNKYYVNSRSDWKDALIYNMSGTLPSFTIKGPTITLE
jgi:hypothetical protein